MTTPPQAIRCVAVEAGKIAALGTEREAVARGAPAGAEVLHWPGGFVLPGLWDTHVHVAGVGEAGAGCALYDARSIDEIVRRLGDHARRNSRAKVILARAANLDAATLAEGRLPTAADLDRAEPDRPVVVTDVNKRVANSAAMRFVGLTAAAPDPPGGSIERDPDGEPTGVVWFRGGQALLDALLPAGRRGDFAERFLAGLGALAARGVTVAVEAALDVEQIETVRRLDAEARLPCRVIVQPAAWTPEQIRALEASGLEFAQALGPRSWVGPAKLFYDRFVMHRSARMARAYPGEPDNTGEYILPPADLARRLREAMDRGFPVAVHVTGDAGLAEALDALERQFASRRGAAPAGSFLIHGYFPPPGAPERMADLGIGLAAQPAFGYHWADTLERFIGRERAEHFYPLDRYLAAGVALGAGSDGPIVEPDPFLGLAAMVTRRSASGRTWGPEHALGAAEALSLYTDRAARLFAWTGLSARLAVGEPADFVVLDRDPLAADPHDLRAVRVLATCLAGREVYRSDAPA